MEDCPQILDTEVIAPFRDDLRLLNAALSVAGAPCDGLFARVLAYFPLDSIRSARCGQVNADALSNSKTTSVMLKYTLAVVFSTSSCRLAALRNESASALRQLLFLTASHISNPLIHEDLLLTLNKGIQRITKQLRRADSKTRLCLASLLFRVLLLCPDPETLLKKETVGPSLQASYVELIGTLQPTDGCGQLLTRVGRFAVAHPCFGKFLLEQLQKKTSAKTLDYGLIVVLSQCFKRLKKTSEPYEFDVLLGHRLRDAWMATMEMRPPADIQDAFDPWIQCLTLEDLETETFAFKDAVSRSLRRSAQTAVSLWTHFLRRLSVELSHVAISLVEASGLLDMLKNEKTTVREDSQEFLAALFSKVVKGCLRVFHAPLSKAQLVKVHEKLGYIEAIHTVTAAAQVPVNYLAAELYSLFEPHEYFLNKGLTKSELNDLVRASGLSLAGRCLQLCGWKQETRLIIESLATVLSDTRASDKLKISAAEAMALSLEDTVNRESVSIDVCRVAAEPLAALLPLALTKPAMRLLSLYSFLVLLRIERLHPGFLTSYVSMESLQKILLRPDSFLNSLGAIGKASPHETVVHAQVVACLLSLPQGVLFGYSLVSLLPPEAMNISFGESEMFPPQGSLDQNNLAVFRGFVALLVALFERRLWNPAVMTVADKCKRSIRIFRDSTRWDLAREFNRVVASTEMLSLLVLGMYHLLENQNRLSITLAQPSKETWEPRSNLSLFVSSIPSQDSFRRCLHWIVTYYTPAVESLCHRKGDLTVTLLCFQACHPLVGYVKSTHEGINMKRYWRTLLLRHATPMETLCENDIYPLCPDASLFPIVLNKIPDVSAEQDLSGFRQAYVWGLSLLNPQISFELERHQRRVPETYSHNVIVEAARQLVDRLASQLDSISLPMLSSRDTQMYFAREGKLFIEEGVYVAKEVEDKNIRIDKGQRELYGEAAEDVVKGANSKAAKVPNNATKHLGRPKQQPAKGNKTRVELELEEIAAQSAQRREIHKELCFVVFTYDCLSVMSYANTIGFESAVPSLIPRLMRLFKCPISATQTLLLTRTITSRIVPPTVFSSPMLLPEALFHIVLQKPTLNSDVLNAVQEVSMITALSRAAMAIIQPVIFYLVSDKHSMGPKALTAALEFLTRQLRLPDSFVDLKASIECIHMILRKQPNRAGIAADALDCICSSSNFTSTLVESVTEIGRHNDTTVRLTVVTALTRARCSLNNAAAYLRVCCADDSCPKIQSMAASLLEENSLTLDLDVLERFFDYIADPNDNFRQLASKALALAIYDLKKCSIVDVSTMYSRLIDTYKDSSSFDHRLGIAQTLTELARRGLVDSENLFELVFQFLIGYALNDGTLSAENSTAPLLTALETLGLETIAHSNGALHTKLVPIFESVLVNAAKAQGRNGCNRGATDVAAALFFGAMAKFMSPDDPAVKKVLEKLFTRIQDSSAPTRAVQRKIADVIFPLVKMANHSGQIVSKELVDELLENALNNESFVSRNGYALALAAVIKGVGIVGLKENELLRRLLEAAANKRDPVCRQGAMLCFQALSEVLGRSFEPYVVQVLGTLMTAFSDTAQPVQHAAQQAAKAIMSSLSAHGIKLILPILMSKVSDKQWRTRLGSIEALGAMAYCAPKQLASLLPQVVPQLCDVASDAHPQVKSAAQDALRAVASVISNEEIKNLSPVLLDALIKPSNETASAALDALLETEFVNPVDSPSLALICPIVVRALRERSSETKKKAAAIVASMVHLCRETSDFLPYFPQIRPQLQETLLDPIPDVRNVAARAFGTIARGLGDKSLGDLLEWLIEKLRSKTSSVERSGAANGLSQVLAVLGPPKLAELLPGILQNAESDQADIREGYLGLFVFLPSAFGADFQQFVPDVLPVLLRGLSWESEALREVAFRAAEVLVLQYGATHTVLLLRPLEDGVFHPNWRIRHSAVSLLGTLADRLLRFSSGAETSEVLSLERRAFILCSLYIVRSDENPVVRQQATIAWKSVVQNTPKTLKEILPILLRRLCANLDPASPHKQTTAARCIADLASKFPDQVLPDLMPRFVTMLSDPSRGPRHGACVGVSALVGQASRSVLLSYGTTLLPALQKALCDEDTNVRQSATLCLGKYLEGFGPDGFPSAISDIITAVCVPPTFNLADLQKTSRAAQLNCIELLLETQHQQLIQPVLQACQGPPLDLSRIQLMGCFAKVQQTHAFQFCVSRVFAYLIDAGVLALSYIGKPPPSALDGIEDPNILEHFDAAMILEQAQASAETLIRRCALDENVATNVLVDLLEYFKLAAPLGDFTAGGKHKLQTRLKELGTDALDQEKIQEHCEKLEQNPSNHFRRAIILHYLSLYIRTARIDMKQHVQTFLRAFVPAALLDPSPLVREYGVDAVSSLTAVIKKLDSTGFVVVELREVLLKTLTDPISGKENKDMVFLGLSLRGSLDNFYSIYHTGLMVGSPDVREAAALGLGELFSHCPLDALKPVAVKVTGPLIRAAAERVAPAIKCAILNTLRILLVRAGPFLRPLLPQLQISFVKAVPDPSAAVRRVAANGLGCLAEVAATRTEALITELCSHLGTQQDPSIRAAVVQALRDVLAKLPSQCTDVVQAKITKSIEALLYNRSTPDTLRAVSAECHAALLACHTSSEKLSDLLKGQLSRGVTLQDADTRQGTAMTLSELAAYRSIWETEGGDGDAIRETLVALLELIIEDERANIRRYGVTGYGELLKMAKKSETICAACRSLLVKASAAINSFGSTSAISVMYAALQGLKSFTKHMASPQHPSSPLSLQERACILLPALNGLSLPHPGVKLTAERILFYALEVPAERDGAVLAELQATSGILDASRLQLLAEYNRRVLSKMSKCVSDSEDGE